LKLIEKKNKAAYMGMFVSMDYNRALIIHTSSSRTQRV